MFYNREVIILCAGRTLLDYQKHISKLITDKKLISIGINNMTGIFVPDYHLWTNKKRFLTFAQNISKKSHLLIGEHLPHNLVRKHTSKKYECIKYTDKPGKKLKIDKKCIIG